MNKDKWLIDNFSLSEIPEWNCPSCHTGSLEIVKEEFHSHETSLSKQHHEEDWWEPEFIKLRFHGALKCKNCKDIITINGDGVVDSDIKYDYQGYAKERKDIEIYYPKFFNPPLEIIELDKDIPSNILDEVISSFSAFWNDTSTCANKLRKSLELLMNELNVNRTFINNKKKRQYYTLDKRIELFKKINPEIGESLLAIKWVGNSGSHIGKLTKEDILDTYELLEYSLNKIFSQKDKVLLKRSKTINKNKGIKRK